MFYKLDQIVLPLKICSYDKVNPLTFYDRASTPRLGV